MSGFFVQKKLSGSVKIVMEQARRKFSYLDCFDGFKDSITQLMDFCKSLPCCIKEWIGSIDLKEFLPLQSVFGGKSAIQPIAQFAGANHANFPLTEQKDKECSIVHQHQNVRVHVNCARDSALMGHAVRHALQWVQANALHGGTE
ncbi:MULTISPECIES: hypothetical protein [unclassified Bartonella]|uniref:hypothetical protein n=1 Tax=unclassified Bartonella TaxID=2645622 RepID=UPI0035CF1680